MVYFHVIHYQIFCWTEFSREEIEEDMVCTEFDGIGVFRNKNSKWYLASYLVNFKNLIIPSEIRDHDPLFSLEG